MRRESLQLDNQDATQIVAGPLVELPCDIAHLAKLRHVGQALLKLVERQGMDASEVGEKVIVEDSKLAVLWELHVHLDQACAQIVSKRYGVHGIFNGQRWILRIRPDALMANGKQACAGVY